jgi:ElaA protein
MNNTLGRRLMDISIKTFDELTTRELYELLQLRSEVFVVEQDCVYQDIDAKDQKALHVLGKKKGNIVGYTRCFPPGIYFKEAAIGRVVVAKEARNYGYGHDLMDASKEAIKNRFETEKIKLSAQTYLISFYKSHGFEPVGAEYLEDGIPHIAMVTV